MKCSPHTSRGKYKGSSTGPGSDGILRIATNLLEVPAEIIAYENLGTEAIRRLKVADFPAIIAYDCFGNSVYK